MVQVNVQGCPATNAIGEFRSTLTAPELTDKNDVSWQLPGAHLKAVPGAVLEIFNGDISLLLSKEPT